MISKKDNLLYNYIAYWSFFICSVVCLSLGKIYQSIIFIIPAIFLLIFNFRNWEVKK